MEFDIKELTITLMVGAFVILGFEAILYYFFDKALIGVFHFRPHQPGTGTEHKLTSLIMLLVFAFGLGVIVENLSEKYVDSNNFPFKTIPARLLNNIDHAIVPELGLPPAEDDRAITLIGNFNKPDPSLLAKDLARNGAFSIDDPENNGETVKNWILNPTRCNPLIEKKGDDCASKKNIESSAKTLYYYAKNTAYSHPQYYDELTRMEHRLSFMRSVSFVAFVYAVSASVLFAIGLILKRTSKSALRIFPTKRIKTGAWLRGWTESLGRQRLKPLGVLALMLAVYFFSIWAYGRESDQFNRRAFGYFSTMLITEKRRAHQRWDTSAPKYKHVETQE